MSLGEEVTRHMARNAAVLSKLEERGIDLNAPRSIDLFFVAPDKITADLVSEIVGSTFVARSSLGTADADGTIYVTATISVSPNEAASEVFTRAAAKTAADCCSSYDGWGTEI